MKSILYVLLIFITFKSISQEMVNYDESRIPDYTLPELLVTLSGEKVLTSEDWINLRRPEILTQLAYQEYGKIPDTKVNISFEIVENARNVLDGMAHRKQVKLIFSNGKQKHTSHLLIYLPASTEKPVPVFLAYNFRGNHTIYPDPEINISNSWVQNAPNTNIFNNSLDEQSRGSRSTRWPVWQILNRGYGLAVMYYGDIDPDFDDGFKNGIHPLFNKPGQMKPDGDQWGSIGAWAYGLSKALDYLQTDAEVNSEKIAVLGHSRLGKTSLWAGALDDRFALVISNESGCGGAALSKREIGERIGRINSVFPHWFCDNFNNYNYKEASMPFDQHMLIALIAPRPVYIASAAGDRWADPKGEFLSAYHASQVFHLFGLKGIEQQELPEINSPLKSHHVGYHIRSGNHDLTYYDWKQFMDFADLHFGM